MNAPARPASPWPPLIIGVAPTGARLTRSDHPAVPLSPGEIAAAAAACRDAGAALLHLHVRDADGAHLLDADAYREATHAVRRAVGDDMIIQVSTDAVGRYSPEQQMAMVRELRPEAVSLAVREIVPDPAHERPAAAFLEWLRRERIMVQYIVYSPQGVTRFRDLRRRGVIPGERHFLLFVLGRYAMGQTSTPVDLLPFLMVADPNDAWAVCAFGPWENACALTAAALGGHSRVGFENNVYMSDGSLAPDNAALVAQFRAGAALLGRPVADGRRARSLIFDGFPGGGLETPGSGRNSNHVPGSSDDGARRAVASQQH